MSCYFRHLADVFEAADIEPTKENKQKLDQLIHKIVSQEYKNCPATWKLVKEWLADPVKKTAFIKKLKTQWQTE